MEEEFIGLVRFELKTGHIMLDFPLQKSLEEYQKEVRRLIFGRRRRHEQLPFNLQVISQEQNLPEKRTIVLQVIDSTELFIGKTSGDVPHTDRHLTELNVCIWGTELTLEELNQHGEHRLQNLGDYNLQLLLSRSFEVQGQNEGSLSYLGLVMTWSRWCALKQHSFELRLMMQQEMSEGFKFSYALTQPEALKNMRMADKAQRVAWLVFAQLSKGDVFMTPVADFELALPYFKHYAFAGYPRLLNFKLEMNGQRLREYLKRT